MDDRLHEGNDFMKTPSESTAFLLHCYHIPSRFKPPLKASPLLLLRRRLPTFTLLPLPTLLLLPLRKIRLPLLLLHLPSLHNAFFSLLPFLLTLSLLLLLPLEGFLQQGGVIANALALSLFAGVEPGVFFLNLAAFLLIVAGEAGGFGICAALRAVAGS